MIGFFGVIWLAMVAIVIKIACFEEDVKMSVASRTNYSDRMNTERTSV